MGDRSIVLAAIENSPHALQWAAPELRADRGVVLAALEKDQRALQWVAPELRKDPTVCLAAGRQAKPELRRRNVRPQSGAQCRSSSSKNMQHARLGSSSTRPRVRRTSSITCLSTSARTHDWIVTT